MYWVAGSGWNFTVSLECHWDKALPCPPNRNVFEIDVSLSETRWMEGKLLPLVADGVFVGVVVFVEVTVGVGVDDGIIGQQSI